MLQQLDSELEKKGFEGTVVYGDSTVGNPELLYVVGASLARGGLYVKKKGADPSLVVSNIDVGGASKGIVKNIETYTEYQYEDLLKDDPSTAFAKLVGRVLKAKGVEGAIGLYGRVAAASAVNLAEGLRKLGYAVKGEVAPTVLDTVRETKSKVEIAKISDAAGKTIDIIQRVEAMLRACEVTKNSVSYEGKLLTVAVVKSYIRRLLAERNMSQIGDVIFATGKDSADPHHPGDEEDRIRPGEPIVFDIFPMDASGYCFDCTRTYCLGESSKNLREMYSAVLEAQEEALSMLKPHLESNLPMERVCDIFEAKGFATPRKRSRERGSGLTRGFIHSLGHGLGLSIGERPNLSLYSKAPLLEGHVVTVEPGLYDERIGGVRIEDVVVLTGNSAKNFTRLKKFLEI